MSEIIVGFGALSPLDVTVELPHNKGRWMQIRHSTETNFSRSLYPRGKAVITAGKNHSSWLYTC